MTGPGVEDSVLDMGTGEIDKHGRWLYRGFEHEHRHGANCAVAVDVENKIAIALRWDGENWRGVRSFGAHRRWKSFENEDAWQALVKRAKCKAIVGQMAFVDLGGES